jgi:hypothetical protein
VEVLKLVTPPEIRTDGAPVRVAVGTAVVFRLGEEVGTACRPLSVDPGDVGNADVEERSFDSGRVAGDCGFG